jgi:hypothetical protein
VIDFRYHVVSIVAVFLALTVGLVLGATILGKYAVDELRVQIKDLTTDKNNLQQDNRTQTDTLDNLNAYINSTAPNTVGGSLIGDDVTIVQFANLDPASTAATLSLLGAAGATVTSNITVTNAFTDPASSNALSQVVLQNLPAGQTAVGTTPQLQAANLLAEALTAPVALSTGPGNQATTPSTGMTIAEADSTLTSFSTAGLITVTTMPSLTIRPNLAFLSAPTTANTTAQNSAYLGLAEALRTDGAQPVIGGAAAGDTAGSAQSGGLIDAVMKDGTAEKEVATVDNMNLTIGQVCIVFTLYQSAGDPGGGAGHYGTIGSTDGLLPGKLPIPAATPTSTATPTSPSTGGAPTSPTTAP